MQQILRSKFCIIFFACVSFFNSGLRPSTLDKACAIAGTLSTGAMVYGLVKGYTVLNEAYKIDSVAKMEISKTEMRKKIKTQLLTQSVFTLVMGLVSLRLYFNAQH